MYLYGLKLFCVYLRNLPAGIGRSAGKGEVETWRKGDLELSNKYRLSCGRLFQDHPN